MGTTPLKASMLAMLLVACGTSQKPYNPFKVPRESFYPGLKTVALAPVHVPSDLADPEPVKTRFAALISEQLKAAGLAVVSPEEVSPILAAKTKEIGGIYDPETGRVDEAKSKALEAAVLREVRSKFGADALMSPFIRVVTASLSHDTAAWDGTTQEAGQGGIWKAMLATHSGSIPALTLTVWLSGGEGQPLYAKSGGIQVLGKVSLQGHIGQVPRNELFADEGRNAAAVRIALDQLLHAPDHR